MVTTSQSDYIWTYFVVLKAHSGSQEGVRLHGRLMRISYAVLFVSQIATTDNLLQMTNCFKISFLSLPPISIIFLLPSLRRKIEFMPQFSMVFVLDGQVRTSAKLESWCCH
mmetsp:Transcript_22819/g.31881  ORF Transcript_22819/g.31881 Transcript_22819/m.31881 type:complete len:111 (+) Transcript_22819:39-371(+)